MVVFRARLVRRNRQSVWLKPAEALTAVEAVEAPVEGCDCGLTKTEHAAGHGAAARCSCEIAREAALRAARAPAAAVA